MGILKDKMTRAAMGAQALARVMNYATQEAARMVAMDIDKETAKTLGFSSINHVRECGYDPKELYDLLNDVVDMTQMVKHSLGRHLKIDDASVPRLAMIPVNSDQLHMILYAYLRCANEHIDELSQSAECAMKFHSRAETAGIEAMGSLAVTLNKLHDSVCTGDN